MEPCETCKTCKYSGVGCDDRTGEVWFECRRHAPAFDLAQAQRAFPRVDPVVDGCGDHEQGGYIDPGLIAAQRRVLPESDQ